MGNKTYQAPYYTVFASILLLPVSSLNTLPSTLEVYCCSAVLSPTLYLQTQTRLIIQVFWVLTLCCWVSGTRRFEET